MAAKRGPIQRKPRVDVPVTVQSAVWAIVHQSGGTVAAARKLGVSVETLAELTDPHGRVQPHHLEVVEDRIAALS